MTALAPEVRALVRFAARIADGDEATIRDACHEVLAVGVNVTWVEEVILQTYLLAGFPRALNAMREWRRLSGVAAPDNGAMSPAEFARWREEGERTCAAVYGDFYQKLRRNIDALHPALDEWMIVEGYGKILSRPGLALPLRELCVVAACIATRQDRQLHSHLHGALNVGATDADVRGTLDALEGIVPEEAREHAVRLFGHLARL